jgi:hypothetical protein
MSQIDNSIVPSPMEMLSKAVTAGASIEIIEKFMGLAARAAFDQAIADARAEMPRILKTNKVDFTTGKGRTRYSYEDLASIAKEIDPILSKHGLTYRFRTHCPPGSLVMTITCILSHRNGHREENSLSCTMEDGRPQTMGTAQTYLQRYTLKASVGLSATTDTDAVETRRDMPTIGPRGREMTADIEEGSEPDSVPNYETISEEQVMALREMLESCGGDEGKFCKRMGTIALAHIPADRYEEAEGLIKAKMERAQA